MNIDKNIGYYFITDSGLSLKGNEEDVRLACELGVKVIQYRSKSINAKEMYHEAHKLRQICLNYPDVKFLVNDRVDIALAVDADGVHLGQDDMPYPVARKLLGKKKIIGISTHSVKEARLAEFSNVDYIGVGAIFATTTKDGVTPKGVGLIKDITDVVNIPVVAIGGINMENFESVINSGANSLCSISDVISHEDMKDRIQKINGMFFKED